MCLRFYGINYFHTAFTVASVEVRGQKRISFFVTFARMTIKELKLEIQKSLDNVPESILEDILALLKEANGRTDDQVKFTRNLRDVLAEDKNLLERLAK